MTAILQQFSDASFASKSDLTLLGSPPGSVTGNRRPPCGYDLRESCRGSRGAWLLTGLLSGRIPPAFQKRRQAASGINAARANRSASRSILPQFSASRLSRKPSALPVAKCLTTCPNSWSRQNQKLSSRSCRSVKPMPRASVSPGN